jgi:hypothetical protein
MHLPLPHGDDQILLDAVPLVVDRRARIIAVTDEGARVGRRSQEIVDRVHRDALAALPAPDRKALVRLLTDLVTGPLAEPAEVAVGVRRARQSS